MLRVVVRDVPPIWVGFWVHNSLNRGPFFGRASLNMGGFSRKWQNIIKNRLPKFIIKVGLFVFNLF